MKHLFMILLLCAPLPAMAQYDSRESNSQTRDRYDPGADTDSTPQWKKDREDARDHDRGCAFGGCNDSRADRDRYDSQRDSLDNTNRGGLRNPR